MKQPMRTYVSSSGTNYDLYDFGDTIVVTAGGTPQLVCDIVDNFAELIEAHERNTSH